MQKTKRAAYHHGDLPRVLLASAVEVLDERGPDGFSLREVARRADVAAAAPGHHFGNVAGLLTAVATKSFEHLLADFARASEATHPGRERVTALSLAYVRHYLKRPGMASVMFRSELLNAADLGLVQARNDLREALVSAVQSALPASVPQQHVEDTATAVWTLTHGHIALGMQDTEDLTRKIAFAVDALLSGATCSTGKKTKRS
ncbi:MAG: TetR/AcrR family transcriptional regulator [Pseudomonadota bacterium]